MFTQYLKIGFTHVVPLGYDHLLFIVALFFFNSKLKSAFVQCSVFTIAHSITLALATLGFVRYHPSMIEPLIALSIFLVAIENNTNTELKWWRLALVFSFGLLHGMGFATALADNGLPSTEIITALLGFNMGVEIAQLTIIACCYIMVSRLIKNSEWYNNRIVVPINLIISCIALFWAIERFLSL